MDGPHIEFLVACRTRIFTRVELFGSRTGRMQYCATAKRPFVCFPRGCASRYRRRHRKRPLLDPRVRCFGKNFGSSGRRRATEINPVVVHRDCFDSVTRREKIRAFFFLIIIVSASPLFTIIYSRDLRIPACPRSVTSP